MKFWWWLVFVVLVVNACGGSGGGSENDVFVVEDPHEVRVGFKHELLNQIPSVDEFGALFPKRLRQDLTVMASIGAKTVKVTVYPTSAGLTFEPGVGASFNETNIQSAFSELYAILQTAHDLGLRIVVAFMTNAAYLEGPNGFFPRNHPNWYDYAYASAGAEGKYFLGRDLAAWENRFVRELEHSRFATDIRAYNIATEMIADGTRNGLDPSWSEVNQAILEQLLALSEVPDEKLSADMFWPDEAELLTQIAVATGRILHETEVHSYPTIGYNTNITDAFARVRSAVPAAVVTFGELGVSYCGAGRDENQQKAIWLDLLSQARVVGASEIINWGLWDDGLHSKRDCSSRGRWGVGFEPAAPRNLYGLLVDEFSALPNGDFETGVDGWQSDSADILAESHGPDRLPAATGTRWLHLDGTQHAVTLCSPKIKSSGSRFAVNGYLRTEATSVQLFLRSESERSNTVTLNLSGEGEKFYPMQYLGDGFLLVFPKTVAQSQLCFEIPAGRSIDLDAISISSL